MNGDEVRFERIVHAPPPVVFEAFTEQGGQEAFYGQDDPGWIVQSTCDLRVGGVWAIAFGPGPNELFRHAHVFQIIEFPRRLRMATTEFRLDGSPLHFTTEFTFVDHAGSTLMTMTQTGLPTADLRNEHARGLRNAFDRLDHFIEGRSHS